jgi:hypothetical protein
VAARAEAEAVARVVVAGRVVGAERAVREAPAAEGALREVPAERLELGQAREPGLLAEWAAELRPAPPGGHPGHRLVAEVREPHPPQGVRAARM